MDKKILQIQQLDRKMLAYAPLRKVVPPPMGWIKTIRMVVGMSMQQLGSKLNITKQSVQHIEKREQEGAITLKALREVANALDMQLVYGLLPKDGSLDALLSRKAKALAQQVVLRTSNTMKLEQQENSKSRIEKAVQERAVELKNTMPKALWD
ncbi:MAG: mobile mystery protein A [Prevotellaceae bacterium]|jgi:predicted DNA-binding mobile mystery protein A|nr:mobile mystery protein A [Prevotellaceae bacterium]